MGEFAQGPGRAARDAATAAENAQLDARLEIAAKKAAVQSLEAQAAGVAPEAPGLPGMPGVPGGRVVIERDGKTIILDNPTAEQLAALNGSATSVPALDGSQVVAMSGMIVGALLIAGALVFKYLTARQRGGGAAHDEARMARIENAIETIAVEVERISEGQRFTSRILSEGAAQPSVGAAQGERVMRNNGEG